MFHSRIAFTVATAIHSCKKFTVTQPHHTTAIRANAHSHSCNAPHPPQLALLPILSHTFTVCQVTAPRERTILIGVSKRCGFAMTHPHVFAPYGNAV